MTGLVQAILFSCAVFHKSVNAGDDEKPDTTFRMYCNHPANFGKGVFDEKQSICTVTYNVVVSNSIAALNFCDKQHPFFLVSHEHRSSQVICKIKSHFKCESTEVLVGKKCFFARKSSSFTRTGCGRRHRLHVVESVFEQKWITAFMSNYNMLWVANDPTQVMNLRIKDVPGEVMHGTAGHMISGKSHENMALITSRGAKRAIPRGYLTYATKDTYMPLLCSRDAEVLSSYAAAMINQLSEVGISSHAYIDAYNKPRPFFIPRESVSFETTGQSGVSTRRHQEICKIFLNGYAATPFDFRDVEDLKRLLRKENVNIVAIPGKADEKIVNLDGCEHDVHYKHNRNRYKVEFLDGSSKYCNDRIWQEKHPARQCADNPRTALGFSQSGLVDIPATARLFVLCTFGRPFKSESSGKEALCHDMAHFNARTEKCACYEPSNDILTTKMFFTTNAEKTIAPGFLCLNCGSSYDQRQEAVILIDNTYIYQSQLIRMFSYLIFVFAKTETKVLIVATTSGAPYSAIYYTDFFISTFKTWASLGETLYNKCTSSCTNIDGSFKYIYETRRWFQGQPEHKRTLIFLTGGEYVDGQKNLVMSWLNKLKALNVKIIPVFFNPDTTPPNSYASQNLQVFAEKNDGGIGGRIRRVVFYIDQVLARNACLRL